MFIRCFLLAVSLSPLSAAHAETITVGPETCPAPAEVTIIAAGDIVAVDLNQGRRAADGVIVIYDRRLEGWASRRLFSRFVLAAETGLPPEPETAGICGAPQ